MKDSKLLSLGVIQIYANRYRFNVLTLDAPYAVTNPVHRVWRAAPGTANTRADAKCPVQRLVIVYPVTNAALRHSRVAIDVQGYVVKCVPKGIATNVLVNSKLESTFSK